MPPNIQRKAILLHNAATVPADGVIFAVDQLTLALGLQVIFGSNPDGFLFFQSSLDGVNFAPHLTRHAGSGNLVTRTRLEGIYQADMGGMLGFKAELVGITTGNVTVKAWSSRGSPRSAGPAVHLELGQGLAVGAAVSSGSPGKAVFSLSSAIRARLRFESDVAGTLSAAFIRPDGTTLYTANNPSNVAVTGGNETKMDIDHFGEGLIEFTFTPSAGPGVVTFADISTV